MVKLGKLIDPAVKMQDAALRQWQSTWMRVYGDLRSSIESAQHHGRRVRTIEKRLDDSALMRDYPEGSDARMEAEEVLARHRARLRDAETRIVNIVWQFPEFWRARPAGADGWLRGDWFAYGPDGPDPVVDHMAGRYPMWDEVKTASDQSGSPVNQEPCPY